MSRKTISIASAVTEFNRIIQLSTCSPDIRKGYMGAIEHILHSTNNYCGFRYLTSSEVPTDHLPGINKDEDGDFYPDQPHKRFENTDATRVFYFLPADLR